MFEQVRSLVIDLERILVIELVKIDDFSHGLKCNTHAYGTHCAALLGGRGRRRHRQGVAVAQFLERIERGGLELAQHRAQLVELASPGSDFAPDVECLSR